MLRLLLESLADKATVDLPEDNPVSPQRKYENFMEKLTRFSFNLIAFFKLPLFLLQMSTKAIDSNQIHPERLSGNKVNDFLPKSFIDVTAANCISYKLCFFHACTNKES